MNENPPRKSMSDTKLKMKKIREHQVGKLQNKHTDTTTKHSTVRLQKL